MKIFANLKIKMSSFKERKSDKISKCKFCEVTGDNSLFRESNKSCCVKCESTKSKVIRGTADIHDPDVIAYCKGANIDITTLPEKRKTNDKDDDVIMGSITYLRQKIDGELEEWKEATNERIATLLMTITDVSEELKLEKEKSLRLEQKLLLVDNGIIQLKQDITIKDDKSKVVWDNLMIDIPNYIDNKVAQLPRNKFY